MTLINRACWFLCLLIGAFLTFLPQAGNAQDEFEVRLASPINCEGLDLCYVQNYVDQDDGPGWADYQCGHLTYNGHIGTDIRVSYDDMRRGVPVLAAADGLVVGVRDGIEDISIRSRDKAELAGKYAGNYVYLDHNGGLETQYSHLRNGSVVVHTGDMVRRGHVIGMVGLSGVTEFPHVEFRVHLSGGYVDPFMGEQAHGCGEAGSPLWDEEAVGMLTYQRRGVVDAAFTNGPADLPLILLRAKRPYRADLGPRLTFWAAMFGACAGDTMEISVTDPSGKVVGQGADTLTANTAQKVMGINLRINPSWPPGTYVGKCVLTPAVGGTEADNTPGAQPLMVTRELRLPGDQ